MATETSGLRVGYFEYDDRLCRHRDRFARPEYWDQKDGQWEDLYNQARFILECVSLTQKEAQQLADEQGVQEKLPVL